MNRVPSGSENSGKFEEVIEFKKSFEKRNNIFVFIEIVELL